MIFTNTKSIKKRYDNDNDDNYNYNDNNDDYDCNSGYDSNGNENETLENKYLEYWTIELWNGHDLMYMNSSIFLTFMTIVIVLYYDGMKTYSLWMTISLFMQFILCNILKYIMKNSVITSKAVIMRHWIVIILRIISSLSAFKLLPLSWKVFKVHDMYSFIRILMIGTSFTTLGWQSIAYQLPFKYYLPLQFFFTHSVINDYTFAMCDESGPLSSRIASYYIKKLWFIINNFSYNSIKIWNIDTCNIDDDYNENAMCIELITFLQITFIWIIPSIIVWYLDQCSRVNFLKKIGHIQLPNDNVLSKMKALSNGLFSLFLFLQFLSILWISLKLWYTYLSLLLK